MKIMRPLSPLLFGLCAVLLAGCQALVPAPMAVTDLKDHPAENSLLAGIRAYEEAQYAPAEQQLNEAVRRGLAAPKDRANAQKYLAFIYCTSQRQTQCENAFRAARAADPQFALSKSEAGHPLWGPVYKKVFGR